MKTLKPKFVMPALLAVSVASQCIAASYTISDLGTLGGAYSFGWGLSAGGLVTGEANATGFSVYHAFSYDGTMHDLGTLGGPSSRGLDINSSGVVVGYSDTTVESIYHAFLYDGTMHDLGSSMDVQSQATGINERGQVVGFENNRAFIYDGTMNFLTLAGLSRAFGINESGHVTGEAVFGGGRPSAFIYDGTMHDLGTAGGWSAVGKSINDLGQVAGYFTLTSSSSPDVHAFLFDGTMHDLGTLGGASSYAYGINNSGWVTGVSDTREGHGHAFVYNSDIGMVDLNSLIDPLSPWRLVTAFAINDRGQIAGYGAIGGHSGEIHAFVLTPVLEPSTLVLEIISAGTMIAGLWRPRSK